MELKKSNTDEMIDSLLENLEAGEEGKKETTDNASVDLYPADEEKEGETVSVDTGDVFPADEHTEKGEVEPVDIKETAFPELYPKKDEIEGEEPKVDTEDIYNDYVHDQDTEVDPVDITEMSDYEIMQILDDAGYEPCQENINVLRENPEILEEGERFRMWRAKKNLKAIRKHQSALKKLETEDNDDPDVLSKRDKHNYRMSILSKKLMKNIDKLPTEKKAENDEGTTAFLRSVDKVLGRAEGSTHKDAEDKTNAKTPTSSTSSGSATGTPARKKTTSGKKTTSTTSSTTSSTSSTTDARSSTPTTSVSEMSDYEIMQILDDAGYEPCQENVDILRANPELLEEDSIAEENLEGESPDVAKAEDDGMEGKDADRGEKKDDEDDHDDSDDDKEDSKEEVDKLLNTEDKENDDEKSEETMSESMTKLFDILESLDELVNESADPAKLSNDDVYCSETHKQVEDVVAVIIESAKELKAAGKPVTQENLVEAAEKNGLGHKLTENANLEDYKKELEGRMKWLADHGHSESDAYDNLKTRYNEIIEKEKNNSSNENKKIGESVQYNSLQEACLLDENYFNTDSYICESADAKKTKLTEQVALLIAREKNDPIYNELIKESAYVLRLQESLIEKYKGQAARKADSIINK